MSRPARILVFNGSYVRDHADRDVPFVQELRRRGYLVDYVLGAGSAVQPEREHPRGARRSGRLSQISTVYCATMLYLERLIARSDLVLLGTFKGASTVAALAKRYRKVVGRYDHLIDEVNPADVDFVATAGPYFKELLLEQQRGFASSSVFVVGSLRFDRAQWTEIQQPSREEFCQLYGCDPSKKIALFLPTSPGAMDDWYVDVFETICETVKGSAEFTLLIKPHPADYVRRRSDRFGGKHSWEVLAPDTKIVQPEHGYQSFRHCEVGITVASDVAFEFALFKRPLVLVSCEDWSLQRRSVERQPHLKAHWPYPVPSWVGVHCKIDQLADVLAKGSYVVNDTRLYEEHIAKYCHSNDGSSYVRLANLIDNILKNRHRTGTGLASSHWLFARSLSQRLGKRVRSIVGLGAR